MEEQKKLHAHLIELPETEHLIVCGVAELRETTRAEVIETMIKHYLFLCSEQLNDIESRK